MLGFFCFYSFLRCGFLLFSGNGPKSLFKQLRGTTLKPALLYMPAVRKAGDVLNNILYVVQIFAFLIVELSIYLLNKLINEAEK
jgi:hypothetical protein